MPATVLLVFHVERKRKRRSIGPDLGLRPSGSRWSVVVENKSVSFLLCFCMSNGTTTSVWYLMEKSKFATLLQERLTAARYNECEVIRTRTILKVYFY